MQILLTVIAAAVAAMQLSPPVARSQSLLVRAVIDGDTIDVSEMGRVRLLGIDAPEIGHKFDESAPFGQQARERLASLVLHHWVRLEQEGPRRDAYQRHLAYVLREDGVFVNAMLVREGLARVSSRTWLSRLDELQGAQAEAQRLHRGMWAGAASLPSPGYTSRSSSQDRTRAGRVRAPRAKTPVRAAPDRPRPVTKKKKKT